MLVPAPNAEPAQWLVAGLQGFAESVLSLVPAGFPPAVRWSTATGSWKGEQVRWAEIAAANGRRVHPGMQLGALTGSHASVEQGQGGVFDHPPEIGSLPAVSSAGCVNSRPDPGFASAGRRTPCRAVLAVAAAV
jgi:hypothetical protein